MQTVKQLSAKIDFPAPEYADSPKIVSCAVLGQRAKNFFLDYRLKNLQLNVKHRFSLSLAIFFTSSYMY